MEWRFRKAKTGKTNIVTSRKDPLWHQCECVEFRVFQDCNYIDPTGRQRLDDFDQYQSSIFVAAGDMSCGVTGTMRLVFNTSSDMQQAYFPTLDRAMVIERPFHSRTHGIAPGIREKEGQILLIYRKMYEKIMGLPATQCADVATMAILPGKRDARASRAMITRSLLVGWERSIRYALGAIDTRFYIKLKQRGIPLQDLGPSIHYWGSPTTPILLDIYKIPKGWGRLLIPIMKLKGKLKGAI